MVLYATLVAAEAKSCPLVVVVSSVLMNMMSERLWVVTSVIPRPAPTRTGRTSNGLHSRCDTWGPLPASAVWQGAHGAAIEAARATETRGECARLFAFEAF
ncbi:unnamed protein product [Amoebophrya sp. A120]|nr:unnamed protein product [Amoebophrya sp. A120]|eukprot:GSA120T00017857001.1